MSESTFAGPDAPAKPIVGDQYYEDFEIGAVFRAAPFTLTEADIIEFANRYDPQEFHTDPEAARKSHFGGLIASGLQVMSLSFRSMIDAGFMAGGGMGSPGLDEVRWHRPARPGDMLCCQAEVLESRLSGTREDRGYVKLRFATFNQKNELVMSYYCLEILKRRG